MNNPGCLVILYTFHKYGSIIITYLSVLRTDLSFITDFCVIVRLILMLRAQLILSFYFIGLNLSYGY